MKQQAFTLIELLVVIVIIGILATITTATFNGYFEKARDVERQTTVANLQKVITGHFLDKETVDYSRITSDTFIADCSNLATRCISEQLLDIAEKQGVEISVPGDLDLVYMLDGDDDLSNPSERYVLGYCSESSSDLIIMSNTSSTVTEINAQSPKCKSGRPNDDGTNFDPSADGTICYFRNNNGVLETPDCSFDF